MRLIQAFFLSTFALTTLPAYAAVSPISVSIVPPVQFPPRDFNVAGVRVGLMSDHRTVSGIDVGLINITEIASTGLAIAGITNYTKGTTTGVLLQAAGITNVNLNKTQVYGIQFAGLVNSNVASSTVGGIEFAAIANLSPYTGIYGIQVGIYNNAHDIYGLQIGVVNVVENLHGIQIGLVNFNHSGPLAISPIINIGF